MIKKQNKGRRAESGVVLQVNLLGAILFSGALVLAAGMVTYAVARSSNRSSLLAQEADLRGGPAPGEIPPWGELVIRDIKIQPPEEYLAFELQQIKTPTWIFDGLSLAQVRELMLSCGLTQAQVDRALVPAKVSVSGANTMVTPDNDLIMGLSPQTRAKLYHE